MFGSVKKKTGVPFTPSGAEIELRTVEGREVVVVTFKAETDSASIMLPPKDFISLCESMDEMAEGLKGRDGARRAAGNGPVPRIPGMKVGT